MTEMTPDQNLSGETKKKTKSRWLKSPFKELMFTLLGGIISFASTLATDYMNSRRENYKLTEEKKESYIKEYSIDLDQRFKIFSDLVDEDGILNEDKLDTLNIQKKSQELEEVLLDWEARKNYNQLQFHRFFKTQYDNNLKKINDLLNEYSRYAEANDKRYQNNLVTDRNNLSTSIQNFENEIIANEDH